VSPIDSTSVGDSARFRTLADLERGLAALTATPADRGRVALIVRRVENGRREVPGRVTIAPDTGVPGDAWGRRPGRDPAMQLAVMQLDVAELIANGQPLALYGDNLFLDLDLSTRNLPLGSRVRAGDVVLEVTPAPHNGCRKFRARFGDEALRFVSSPSLRSRNLRGIYLRVVAAGALACGDAVEVLSRPDVLCD
jgi:MOSC domain-containing protein YiiM